MQAILSLSLLAVACASYAAPESVHVAGSGVESLRGQLIDLARDRLRPLNIVVSDARAWLTLSGPIADAKQYAVTTRWPADTVPPLPLVFELTPVESTQSEPPIRAALAVSLQRQVLVAARRLRKGSSIGCDDTLAQLRDIRYVPSSALDAPCVLNARLDAPLVARRDIAAGDVLRASDAGEALAVAMGDRVELKVRGRGIDVSTTAVALTDASIGDLVDVRLAHPLRTLRTRVTDHHVVQIVEDRP